MSRALLVTLLLITLTARPARADVLLAGVAGTPTDAVLVGPGGQVYRPSGPGFRLLGGGGVATTVLRAAGAPGDILVTGGAAPPYRHDGTSWSALPVGTRGAVVLSSDGLPAIAVGRRLLYWSGGRLTPLAAPSLPAPSALLVRGPREAVAAVPGELRRFDGKAWAKIPAPLLPGETVALLAGGGGAPLVAVGSTGTLLLVNGRAAAPLALPPGLAGLQATAAVSAGAETLVAGAATLDGSPALVVVAVGGAVSLRASLPLAAGDVAVGLLAQPDGALLLVTRLGAVHRRAASGEITLVPVDASLPASPRPANPPALTPAR